MAKREHLWYTSVMPSPTSDAPIIQQRLIYLQLRLLEVTLAIQALERFRDLGPKLVETRKSA